MVDPAHIAELGEDILWKARFPATSYNDLKRTENRVEILEKMTNSGVVPSSIEGKEFINDLVCDHDDCDLVQFRRWKATGAPWEEGWRYGVIAEELDELESLRQFVVRHDDGRIRGVNYDGLFCAVISANKEHIHELQHRSEEFAAGLLAANRTMTETIAGLKDQNNAMAVRISTLEDQQKTLRTQLDKIQKIVDKLPPGLG